MVDIYHLKTAVSRTDNYYSKADYGRENNKLTEYKLSFKVMYISSNPALVFSCAAGT